MATVERLPKSEAAIIKTGAFRIDLATRSVTLRGRALRLAAEEFDLLVFLTSHPKKMVTPSTTLSTHWPGQGIRQTDFFQVLLSLRKKLDETGTHYLRTEPWIVYRFDPAP
jgi:DNA-binding response OmpR family regulator